MSYKLKKKKSIKYAKTKIPKLNGYPLASSSHGFVINNVKIKNIMVMEKATICSLISKKVNAKYIKIIKVLTELLVSDDETGGCYREALNLIEKFRLEIKNKYRHYLSEKELKEMGAKLKMMQQIAMQKEIEMQSFSMETLSGKSR